MPKEYQGFVAQAEADQFGNVTTRFVPWQQADAIGEVGTLDNRITKQNIPIPQDAFGNIPVLRKRTPQERLNEMTAILVQQYQEWGFLPESILQEIQGIYWANGQPTSADELRSVAGEYLRLAEAEARRK